MSTPIPYKYVQDWVKALCPVRCIDPYSIIKIGEEEGTDEDGNSFWTVTVTSQPHSERRALAEEGRRFHNAVEAARRMGLLE